MEPDSYFRQPSRDDRLVVLSGNEMADLMTVLRHRLRGQKNHDA